MRLVLLSGGSGMRLWPLSQGTRTKQFLKVLSDQDGQRESMVQRVWRQLTASGLADRAYVAAGASQSELIVNHLGPEAKVILEPERRDTFPAIALASAYLYSEEGAGEDEVVAVLPVDPYVDTSFFEKVKELESLLITTDAELALIGSRPTYPSEKYGYIIPDRRADCPVHGAYVIQGFKEKPSPETAASLIQQGALWNCGIFAYRLGYMLQHLRDRGLPDSYEELAAQYGDLPKRSFDYEVVEQTQHMVAVEYAGGWKDLGTWNTLTEEMDDFVTGKGILGDNCLDTHVINELPIPVAVLGLSHVVVACSPDGILVADKGASPRVKQIAEQAGPSSMYGETRWGDYTVLHHSLHEDGEETLVRKLAIQPSRKLGCGRYADRDLIWTVQSGDGLAQVDGQQIRLTRGHLLRIERETLYAVTAEGLHPLTLTEVQLGRRLLEETRIPGEASVSTKPDAAE